MSKDKALVIVESPAKARTISKFLGDDFTVEASIGHIRDLPNGAKEIPEKFKSKDWAYLGVDVEHDFEPVYIIPPEKKQQVKKLKELLKDAKELYLATDEDREGEAISWHLQEVLKPKVPVHRLVFHEITRDAIQKALQSPRKIDEALVRAQETRRILDRLYGYDVSQLLWKKIRPKLSAGRVQSVALRLIVDRERERIRFKPATYADLEAELVPDNGNAFVATLVRYQGRRLATGKDFDPETGTLKNPDLLHLDEQSATELAEQLRGKPFRVVSVETRRFKERPKPPFITSTLQQEANRKLGFTARRTMQIAQYLYENGYITYMRTDSTNLSQEAIQAARNLVQEEYGQQYLSPQPRQYSSKVKNAQEAHEAIRPAGQQFELPQRLKHELNDEQFKLYELIWKRTIASQMRDAEKKRVTVTIEADGALFQASGTSIEFDGFLRAYVEGSDNPEEELAGRETLLPELKEEQPLTCRNIEAKVHTTQPPPRYTEASLTRVLEEKGIGRPSTYATIIDTILRREYVFKKGNALVPTWTAFAVIGLLEEHFPELVDYDFTAQMEDYLDAISRAEKHHLEYLRDFYFGEEKGLKPLLESKIQEIDPREMCRILIGRPTEGEHQEDIYVRVGRYGPYIEQGDRRASIPDDLPPDELTVEKALELLDAAQVAEEPLGHCDKTGHAIYVKSGRFGAYVQKVDPEGKEKPKSVSLLKGMDPASLSLETAQKLLELPRELGQHPESGEPVVVATGRYGPYVKCGSETRSLPTEISPLDVTLEQALEVLKQPKRRGRSAKKSEPLKTFPASPKSGQPVQLLDGRFGPYVTDGETNASIPKEMDPEQITFEQALDLLEAKAASGGSKKKTKKKATAKKKTATKKKKAAKKAVKKKTTKKSS